MKILNEKELVEEIEKLKKEGKIIVTTNGSFDILHWGHVSYLKKAKNQGDILVVLINSDNSIKRAKGEKRPIIPEYERAKMLEALECVDYVSIFNEDTPLRLLELIKPSKHVKGGSFIQNRVNEEKNLIESYGGEHKILELEDGFSTTNIINKILEKYKE